MKRFRIIGLSLLALLALGAFAASTASAEEGVLPLNMKHFNILGELAILQTTAGSTIHCLELKGEGKFENDSHGKATLDFLRCTFQGFPAFSLGEKEPKEVQEALILAPVLFLICLVNSAKLTFGLFVELTEPVHIHVPALGVLITVSGAVIGESATTEGKLFIINFKGKNGKQEVAKECVDSKGGKKTNTLKTTDPAEESASEEVTKLLIQFLETEKVMDT